MTSPVQDVVTAGQGPFCSNDFDVGFFLPYNYQQTGAHVPEPTSSDVVIKVCPADPLTCSAALQSLMLVETSWNFIALITQSSCTSESESESRSFSRNRDLHGWRPEATSVPVSLFNHRMNLSASGLPMLLNLIVFAWTSAVCLALCSVVAFRNTRHERWVYCLSLAKTTNRRC